MRDRMQPSLWAAIETDCTSGIDPEVRSVLARDYQRGSRRYVWPWARVVSRASIAPIIAIKRVLPFQFRSLDSIDRLCIWFLRRWVAPEAAWLLLRHFHVEANLLRFAAANSSGEIAVDAPLPTSLDDLRQNAVIEHDLSFFNLILDVNALPSLDLRTGALDYSALTIETIDVEQTRRRWLNLDLRSALCFMNIAFCFFTSEDEYERAINSLQLDEPLMNVLSELTGDPTFRTWRPTRALVDVSIARDVPNDLFWHAVIHEYAHGCLQSKALREPV